MLPIIHTIITRLWQGSRIDRIRSREAGFDSHFTKPVNPDDLAAFLQR